MGSNLGLLGVYAGFEPRLGSRVAVDPVESEAMSESGVDMAVEMLIVGSCGMPGEGWRNPQRGRNWLVELIQRLLDKSGVDKLVAAVDTVQAGK